MTAAAAGAIPGGLSGYEPWVPTNVPFDTSVKQFIRHFFEVSDDPARDAEWVGMFREDATVMMGGEKAVGRAEIQKLRRQMWRDVSARKHRVVKVFPGHFSEDPGSVEKGIVAMNEAEFMAFGAVAYRMRDEEVPDSVVSWAGHGRVRRENMSRPWRWVFWRVYLQA
ncbi:hypothetical protein VTJ04DRAFT_446 [Mycothermus thermophilus]|uniref:uncharacterized protein n=1 Tax=Humicola insolens TaxID=85995 RepID=UPI0037428694